MVNFEIVSVFQNIYEIFVVFFHYCVVNKTVRAVETKKSIKYLYLWYLI